ncbi:hypothetical protein ACN38_g12546 [Penicillium nordicum]|uniref:Uncharacterized protein n=1 Tax=Penicillium nordicum TaxID=229535 RepID=A0A0M9WA50_9EURO|nr:hypothetical protein ACN38_g12546 [Penicillium nordicum]
MLIKIVMSLTAIYGLRWRQVGFTAAYLNASRDEAEVVYMRQPSGFEFFDAKGDVADDFTKALGKDKFKQFVKSFTFVPKHRSFNESSGIIDDWQPVVLSREPQFRVQDAAWTTQLQMDIRSRKIELDRRAQELNQQLCGLQSDFQEVRKQANQIERTMENTREETLSPQVQREEYRYPFSSPVYPTDSSDRQANDSSPDILVSVSLTPQE